MRKRKYTDEEVFEMVDNNLWILQGYDRPLDKHLDDMQRRKLICINDVLCGHIQWRRDIRDCEHGWHEWQRQPDGKPSICGKCGLGAETLA